MPSPSSNELAKSSSSSDLNIPSWIRHNREVLCFSGFFKEAVHEKDGENFRIRKLTIYYYLEDDTIQIIEPKFQNSGIPQGVFLKRHRVAKNESEFYSWQDFRIGERIIVYGKAIMLVDCDEATRNFFDRNALDVGEPLEFPSDPFEAARTKFMQRATGADESVYRGAMMNPMKQFMEATLGKHIRDPEELASFLANDRKVLRFHCVWDNRGEVLFGERGFYTLHFFLTDNTAEILEVLATNSGKDPFPKLLTRCRLPLDPSRATTSLLGTSRADRRGDGFLHWSSLRIGECVNVYGRQLELRGCDDFTRCWYLEKGLDQPEDLCEAEVPAPVSSLRIPPHNGFGSEEDSRQSCLHLQMKPARKDVAKILANDMKKLQLSARLVGASSTDADRLFFISVYMADDTLAVFEPAQKNSGVLGGRFLARKQYPKGGSGSAGYGSGPFLPPDFYVGAEITLNNFRFKVIDVDESSLKIMEADPAQFPVSDSRAVLGKVARRVLVSPRGASALSALSASASGGRVPLSELRRTLRSLFTESELCDHEIITALRALDPARSGSVDPSELQAELASSY